MPSMVAELCGLTTEEAPLELALKFGLVALGIEETLVFNRWRGSFMWAFDPEWPYESFA